MDELLISIVLNGFTKMTAEKLQPIVSVGAAVVAIVCLAFCFWGYKLTKVMFAILCFFFGLLLGAVIVMNAGSGETGVGVALLAGAVIGAGLAYLSKYIYKALVFLANAGLVVLLFVLFANDSTVAMMSFLGIALGAVVGFFAVKYIRFSLILFTSVFYGLTAGTSIMLVVGMFNAGLGLLLGAALVGFGFHYQWKTTGGGTFKDYFLLRKTEAEQEKQVAHAAAKSRATMNSGIVSTQGAAVPTDLLGVSFFSRFGAYAAIPLAAGLVLSIMPLGTLGQAVLIILAVAVGIYLSPCAAVGMIVCSRLIGLFQLGNGYPIDAFVGSLAASLLFVAIVSGGCRRFPGILKHIFVFAGAGIVSEFLLLFTHLEYVSSTALVEYFLIPFIFTGICAAAFEEFAMPPIITHLPEKFRSFFFDGARAAEPVAVAVTAPSVADPARLPAEQETVIKEDAQ